MYFEFRNPTGTYKFSKSNHMEIQSDQKIKNDTIVLINLGNASDELSLLNDLKGLQTKIEEKEVDQKETNQLENKVDLQEPTSIQDDKDSLINDKLSPKNRSTRWTFVRHNVHRIRELAHADIPAADELTSDNKIVADLLTQMKDFLDETKQENIEKNTLIYVWIMLHDFFDLIEKHGENLTYEDLLVVGKGFKLVEDATCNLEINNLFQIDSVYAKEIFYLYFNLLNIGLIQNYLRNDQMFGNLGVLYEFCIAIIFFIIASALCGADLRLDDGQRSANHIELLSLIINYVKPVLESSELMSDLSFTNESSPRCQCLYILWNYSNQTILVPDLIETGCPQTIVNGLAMICKYVRLHKF